MPADELDPIEAATARMSSDETDRLGWPDAAAQAVELPPLTTIPTPDYRPGCVIRYWCPLGCGWWHDEMVGAEPPAPPLILPAGFTSADIARAVSEQAAARERAYVARVEQAIAGHFEAAHPDR
ncbi:hypothetical protein F0L17_14500 [Streptomyces sp. TRM43335]|uniref:Uncharacterized protein n=1 Tax=Streptomyces taklimakanensis TaxID=2569853 RepID=A0A6G2BDE8_9ACTN|nr:hypothetical protein [Streptomyces taklimakanensis]MTE20297.1 hypothetical protein [Streptomyces taklimakanensis]